MPPVITPDETSSKDFRARLLAVREKSQVIARALCLDCEWKYEPGDGVNEIYFLSHAAGHTYKGNHDIRFEELDGTEVWR